MPLLLVEWLSKDSSQRLPQNPVKAGVSDCVGTWQTRPETISELGQR
jgi:hypothetical protein